MSDRDDVIDSSVKRVLAENAPEPVPPIHVFKIKLDGLPDVDLLSKASQWSSGFASDTDTYEPPFDLASLATLADLHPAHRTALDVKCEYFFGHGYHFVRADRSEADGWADYDVEDPKGPSKEQTDKYLALLEPVRALFAEPLPGWDFTRLSRRLGMDVEATGNGFIEVIREKDGTIKELHPLSPHTMRIRREDKGGGFVQYILGKDPKFFRKFGDLNAAYYKRVGRSATEVAKSMNGALGEGESDADRFERAHEARELSVMPCVRRWGENGLPDVSGVRVPICKGFELAASTSNDLEKIGEETTAFVAAKGYTRTTEVIHFRPYYSPIDPYYGVPAWVSALTYMSGGRKAATWNELWFGRNAYPSFMIVFETKDTEGAAVLGLQDRQEIEAHLKGMHAGEPHNAMIVTLPSGATCHIETFGAISAQDAGFLDYDERCSGTLFMVHRVPRSVVLTTGERFENAAQDNYRWVEHNEAMGKAYAGIWNISVLKDMGAKDWLLAYRIADRTSENEERRVGMEELRRGALTINEYRKKLGLPPVEGGNEPFLLVPGQGGLLVRMIAQAAEMALGRLKDGEDASNPAAPGTALGTPKKKARGSAMPDQAMAAVAGTIDDVAEKVAAELGEESDVSVAKIREIILNAWEDGGVFTKEELEMLAG